MIYFASHLPKALRMVCGGLVVAAGLTFPAFAERPTTDAQQRMNGVLDTFLRATESPTAQDTVAGTQLQAKFDVFVASINLDNNGNLSSFEWAGKRYETMIENGALRGIRSGNSTISFTIAQSASGAEKSVVIFDSLGRTTGQQAMRSLSTLGPQLVHQIDAMIPADSRTPQDIQATLDLRTGSLQSTRAQDRQKAVKSPETCNSDCDGQRDMEAAGCDGIFDVEIGLIAVLGLMTTEIPDARARAAALAALAAAGLTAAYNRYGCKVGAIVSWAACRAAC